MLSKKIFYVFMVCAFWIIVTGACQRAITSPQHRIEGVAEGTYMVHYRGTLVGYLTLSDDEYSFKLYDDKEFAKAAAEKIFFGKYPNGSFNTRYYESVTKDTLLEDENTYLLMYVTFNNDKADSQDYAIEDTRAFVLGNDKDKKELRLMLILPVFERWDISKPWE